MTVTAPVATCGAKTRSGGTCGQAAGWGTDHVGLGRCKLHGGSNPSGRKAAARQAGMQVAGELGLAVAHEIEPGEALLQVVWLTAGQLAWANAEVAQLGQVTGGEFVLMKQAELQDRLARYSKMALDAGIAERRLRMIERSSEHIAAAFEDALRVFPDASAEQRAEAVRVFAGRLATLGAGDDGDG